MKTFILSISLLLSVSLSFSQNIYKAVQGEIAFFSETPIENIDAHNTNLKALLNTDNNEIAFVVTNVGFKFEKPLMEEHFNENYMESDKYKVSSFKGTISGDLIEYAKDGEYPVTAKGTLDVHGVSQEREIKGTLIVKGGMITMKSEFNIALKDHKIKIPKVVVQNIAETVKVTVNIDFEKK
ncbi:MAG: YceI family protein [Flavobacteriales bacterium]|nr:YceI family protein [Flavobacteriales bacterium]